MRGPNCNGGHNCNATFHHHLGAWNRLVCHLLPKLGNICEGSSNMIDICMALDQSVSPHTGVRTIQNTGVFWQAVFEPSRPNSLFLEHGSAAKTLISHPHNTASYAGYEALSIFASPLFFSPPPPRAIIPDARPSRYIKRATSGRSHGKIGDCEQSKCERTRIVLDAKLINFLHQTRLVFISHLLREL